MQHGLPRLGRDEAPPLAIEQLLPRLLLKLFELHAHSGLRPPEFGSGARETAVIHTRYGGTQGIDIKACCHITKPKLLILIISFFRTIPRRYACFKRWKGKGMNDSAQGKQLIMRLFHVRTKKGRATELIEKIATTSADVVQHEPGNKGYYFGAGVEADEDIVVFASFWVDMDAIKARFGEAWKVSHLPAGYEDLIETCWVQHIDVGRGWNVQPGG